MIRNFLYFLISVGVSCASDVDLRNDNGDIVAMPALGKTMRVANVDILAEILQLQDGMAELRAEVQTLREAPPAENFGMGIAAAYCATLALSSFVAPIRRLCLGVGTPETYSCDQVCQNMAAFYSQGISSFSCVGGLHFYDAVDQLQGKYNSNNITTETSRASPVLHGKATFQINTYPQASCATNYCGPNFCCCRGN